MLMWWDQLTGMCSMRKMASGIHMGIPPPEIRVSLFKGEYGEKKITFSSSYLY